MLDKIKRDVISKCGSTYRFKINNIRNKSECVNGCIKEIYDRIFIVDCGNGLTLSFSYSDLLTGSVEIQDKV